MLPIALREWRVRVLTHSGGAVIPKRTILSSTLPFAPDQPSGPIALSQNSLPSPVSTYSDILSPPLSSLDMDSEIGCTALVVIRAGLWSASLGLAFNPNDHASRYSVGSRRTRTLDRASQPRRASWGGQLEYELAWGQVT